MNNKQIGKTFLFGGGFLGMDNVSCLHRSQLPDGCTLYQVRLLSQCFDLEEINVRGLFIDFFQ